MAKPDYIPIPLLMQLLGEAEANNLQRAILGITQGKGFVTRHGNAWPKEVSIAQGELIDEHGRGMVNSLSRQSIIDLFQSGAIKLPSTGSVDGIAAIALLKQAGFSDEELTYQPELHAITATVPRAWATQPHR